ncbi:MAG: ankyrin repeat domain-containing protein [Anaerolineae bacterium]|nr:ankyrin repeat domain-containing protein [Anaerolineae bacterium]
MIRNPLYPLLPDLFHAFLKGTKEDLRQQIHSPHTRDVMNAVAGNTPLIDALTFRPDLPQAEALLAAGADINAFNHKGEHTLHHCTHHEESVAWLLDHGVDPNVAVQEATLSPLGWKQQAYTVGWTALHSAAQRNNLAIVELLLKHGANPNSTDRWGATPLLEACRAFSLYKRLFRTLIDAGADVNAVDRDGFTPLHRIARIPGVHAKAVLRMLLYRGANPMIKDASGRLPIDLTSNSARGQSLRAILQKNMTHRLRLWYMRVQKL